MRGDRIAVRRWAWRVGSALAALLLNAEQATAAPKTYLASITGIKLKPDEYVAAFSIDTWGVTFKAVCHIPPGWTIKAGNTASFDGQFAGEGSHGITYLDRAHLHELNRLVLISIDEPVQRRAMHTAQSTAPPTFDGSVKVGSYGTSVRDHRVHLNYTNFGLVPASRCVQ